jgi:hypothetical protein
VRALVVTAAMVAVGVWLATLGGQSGPATDWIGSVVGIGIIVVAVGAYLRYLAVQKRGPRGY